MQTSAGPARRSVVGRRLGGMFAAYAFIVAMLGTTLPTPLYPLYRQQFDFSELLVTVIFATYAVGVMLALVLFGSLSDQIGRRGMLLPGIALSAASAIAFLVAGGVPLLFVGRLLSGLSAGIFTGTATATIVELAEPARRGRATLVATAANLGGLGCGPLLAGLLAQYAGAPLRLTFIVDLLLLVVAAVAVWLMPETVETRGRARLHVLRPSVPAEMRVVFFQAAIAGFAGFAVFGLFTAVAPAFLGEVLGVHNHAVVGVVVFVVFSASILGQAAQSRLSASRGLALGCAGLAVGMVVLGLGLGVKSLALLVAGGCIAGVGQGLSFRAGLGQVNSAAPADQRGAVASAFFVVAYVALSLPVVGVGLLAQATTLQTAGLVFSGLVVLLSLAALGLLRRGTAGRTASTSTST